MRWADRTEWPPVAREAPERRTWVGLDGDGKRTTLADRIAVIVVALVAGFWLAALVVAIVRLNTGCR